MREEVEQLLQSSAARQRESESCCGRQRAGNSGHAAEDLSCIISVKAKVSRRLEDFIQQLETRTTAPVWVLKSRSSLGSVFNLRVLQQAQATKVTSYSDIKTLDVF